MLKAEYGDKALSGAKLALDIARRNGDPDTIALWTEVCEIIEADSKIML